MVLYRRPCERQAHPEKVNLEGRALKHVPLLEGEEKIKTLLLMGNEISKIDNLVSLPNLVHLDLSANMLSEINSL